MRHASVVAVAPGSPAAVAGVLPGDELLAVSGRPVRDVIEYRWLADESDVVLEVSRGGLELTVELEKAEGEPLGLEIDSPVLDAVRTCDNHCEFCFIHQLPPGSRTALRLKDDDYRLSFLYGNFTTLTRFTEVDLERVLTEGLSPLYVSLHATDPDVRCEMLRNRRGAMSLRWLTALLAAGVEVHGQIVVCPGVNDGEVLVDTLTGLLDEYPDLADVAVVPLGVSRHNTEARMRPHTQAEAAAVIDAVEEVQTLADALLGRPLVYAADEYYLLAERPFPEAATYGDFGMHEDGIGMARAFELELTGQSDAGIGVQPGFFSWVDGAPAEGYRAPRAEPSPAGEAGTPVRLGRTRGGDSATTPVGIVTGAYGARVLAPLLDQMGIDHVRVVEVDNRHFGGNIGVTGLLVGADIARVLATEPEGHRYLLPDVCLSRGAFLDGTTPAELPRVVEVLPTDGVSLRRALDLPTGAS